MSIGWFVDLDEARTYFEDERLETWAFRWDGSKQSIRTWELVSKERLPDSLRHGMIQIEISGEVL